MLAVVSVVVFAAVVLVVMALAPMFARKVDMRERLSATGTGSAMIEGPRLRDDSAKSLWARMVVEVEKRGLSLKDDDGDMRAEKLMLAGYTQPHAVRVFTLIKIVLVLALPLIAFLIMYAMEVSVTRMYVGIAAAALTGFYFPNFMVSSKAAERKKEILNGFPDTLDLMLVCVEAGLGIDACFSRVGSEITTSHPLLAELLAAVSLELRAGRARDETLKNFARRTALPEISAFVTLLNQSAKLGSSVGQALKVYAAEMREGRRMRAEEKAARLPVLLSIPIVVFLLPTMVSVLIFPAALNVRHNLYSTLNGK